jgi:hypothetical protein
MFIPDPDFHPSRIPDPKPVTKERGQKGTGSRIRNTVIGTERLWEHLLEQCCGTVTVNNCDSGSDFLTSYGSGSTRQKVTVPVPQHCSRGLYMVFWMSIDFRVSYLQQRRSGEYQFRRLENKLRTRPTLCCTWFFHLLDVQFFRISDPHQI